MSLRRLLAGVILAATAGVAHAQSNLSVQGFGYPPGQFSARANGSAGATAEFDPLSPVNPASIAQFGSRIIFFQIEPEWRSVTTDAGTERTNTARYPIIFGALPLSSRFVMSIGSSTFLDRTATTIFNTSQAISPAETILMKTNYHVDGSINDIRLAGAWSATNWMRIGLGVHGIAGSNVVSINQSFPEDSVVFSAFTQQRVISYAGFAGSAGIQVFNKSWLASASFRAGGKLDMSSADTVLASANVPNQFGASVAYTGIANSSIAVRTSHVQWSALNGLGEAGLVGADAWDTSVGVDFAGPHVGPHPMFLRTGFRDRTLPFLAAGQKVTEKSFAAGLGTSLAGNRVLTDLSLIHASRTADLPASEHSWTVSIGLSVLP